MAFAREIFQQIKNHIRFQQAEKDSHYTILGSTIVRISNHCTHMKVWENYFEKHPKYEGMKIVSIVFEDEVQHLLNNVCNLLIGEIIQ